MTTLDLNDGLPAARAGFFAGLLRALARGAERRRRQREIIELSRLDARLLRDVGLEPIDVYDALNGRQRSILFNPVRRTNDE